MSGRSRYQVSSETCIIATHGLVSEKPPYFPNTVSENTVFGELDEFLGRAIS